MVNYIKIISCFSIIFLFFCMTVPASGEIERINIGVLATRGAEDTLKTWSPTAEYLTEEIPQYSFVIVPLDFDEIIPAIERREVDFIITNPSNYVELETSYGTTRIATMNSIYEGHAYKVFGSAILRRADRNDIKELKDLKGKSFVGTHEKLMLWQMAWREFKDNGIDPYRDFAELKFIGLPQDLVVYAVRDKKADAGAVRTGILESMASEGKINITDFMVINQKQNEVFPFLHSTGLYPEWAFARAKQTSDDLSENVAVALLEMPSDSAAAKAANAAWTVPLDYGPVNDLMKELHIGPYKDYGKITIGNVIREYWYLIIIVLATLFLTSGFALYASRTNQRLNNTRIELEKARNNLELRVDERTEDLRKTTERLQESTTRYRSLFANMLNGFAYCRMLFEHEKPIDFIYLDVNSAFEKLTGLNNVVGKKVTEVIPGIRESAPELFEIYGRVALTFKPESFELYLEPLGKWLFISVYSIEKGYFVAIFDNITERKRNEKILQKNEQRVQALLDLFQKPYGSTREIIGFAVEEATKLTDSELGFIGSIDELETTMSTYLWSEKAMQECSVDNKPVTFIIKDGGLWADSVRHHKTTVVNDYLKTNLNKKGFPAGHVPLSRYIGIPVIRGSHTVMVCGLANKKEEYDEFDIQQIGLFMEGLWGILSKRKVEDALQESEKRFSIFMANLPAAVFIKNDEGHTLYANRYLTKILQTQDWAGKTTLDLLPGDVARQMIDDDRKVLAENRLVVIEETLVVNGLKRIFETFKFPVPLEGKPMLLGGIAVDITDRKMAEELIKNSLQEKELLLKEIHHRVKNNLQIVSSLITLQSEYIKDKEGQKAFAESRNRIDTMALIHEKLYMSVDISKIDFSDYVNELVGNLFISYGINNDIIKSKIDIANVFFDINTAIPLGLLINELVSNIMKHAFPEGRKGEFLISLYLEEADKFTLVISDNGIGFPQDLDFANTRSLGLKLVNSLTKQLGGTIELDRKTGTTFKIIFQKANKKGEFG